MGWKKGYLDTVLVPTGLLFSVLYHIWLWQKVRSQPQHTAMGIDAAGRRLWVMAMVEKDSKHIIVVQSIRNAIMGTVLMATNSIVLSAGLAALISNSGSTMESLNSTFYGAHGEFVAVLKYVILLAVFLSAFLFYSLAIRFVTQANFLVNVARRDNSSSPATVEYVCGLLDKGFALSIVGDRIFYLALPLLLWLFGPVLVFVCQLSMIPILYNTDIVCKERQGGLREKVEEMNRKDSEVVVL